MRNPLRTEAEAFSYVLVVGALFLGIALGGLLGGARVALGIFVGVVLGIAAGIYLRGGPDVREPAVWERTPPPVDDEEREPRANP